MWIKIDPNIALQQRAGYDPEYEELLHNTETGEEQLALYPRPVHFEKWNAEAQAYLWSEIDTAITPEGTTPGVPFDVYFRPVLHEDGAVRYYARQGTAAFFLRAFGYSTRTVVQYSTPATINGNTATYQFAWGKIIYEILPAGLKETIIIEVDPLGDPTAQGLSLESLDVEFDFDFPPVAFETPPIAFDIRNNPLKIRRTSTGLVIPYTDYAAARFPITIDPTLTITAQNSGCVSSFGGVFPSVSIGIDAGNDGKNSWWNLYRGFVRFNIGSLIHHTVYGNNLYQHTPLSNGSQQSLTVEQIADWGNLDASDWSLPALSSLGNIPNNVNFTYVSAATSIQSQVISIKNLASPWIAFRIRATDEGASGHLTVASVIPHTHSVPPRLLLNTYNSFTQNTPSDITENQVRVNWTHGTGSNQLLHSNDRRRVFFRQGTGHTVDHVIANGTFVSTANNTDNFVVVSGLLPATAYSFVVVDTQWDGAVLRPGARSTIQTVTTRDSIPTGVTASTRRNPLRVELAWNAVTGATSYKVLRGVNGGNLTVIGTPISASFIDNNILNGHRYIYGIVAVTSLGDSPTSAIVSIDIPSLILPVSNDVSVLQQPATLVSLSLRIVGVTANDVAVSNLRGSLGFTIPRIFENTNPDEIQVLSTQAVLVFESPQLTVADSTDVTLKVTTAVLKLLPKYIEKTIHLGKLTISDVIELGVLKVESEGKLK